MSEQALAADEIRRLHLAFERWFDGDGALDFADIADALAEDFTFVAPDGEAVDRGDLLGGLRAAFGTGPIRIRIEHPVVHWEEGGVILATYEEWQETANRITGRRSTVLLSRDADTPGGLMWRHVHETWIRPPQTG